MATDPKNINNIIKIHILGFEIKRYRYLIEQYIPIELKKQFILVTNRKEDLPIEVLLLDLPRFPTY